ncbi:hypothetical protein GCM10011428_02060 [Streptomyces violaceus]|uniref:hypothetical protein n=1 Tax=Streptomyces violaceus TaxID=1936 RepID=UPI0031EAE22C
MTTPDARDPQGDDLEAPRPRLPEGFRIEGWELGAVIGSGGWGTCTRPVRSPTARPWR